MENIITPFIKGNENKTKLAPLIAKHFPNTIKDYYEPFMKEGTIMFYINDRIRSIHISSTNTELIEAYLELKNKPLKLCSHFIGHNISHNKEYYEKIKNSPYSKNKSERAAQYIYLNYAFHNKPPQEWSIDHFKKAHKVLQRAFINNDSYEYIEPKEATIYCEPLNYEFNETQQKLLKEKAIEWTNNRSCEVYILNNNTENTKQLYADSIFNQIELNNKYTLYITKQK